MYCTTCFRTASTYLLGFLPSRPWFKLTDQLSLHKRFTNKLPLLFKKKKNAFLIMHKIHADYRKFWKTLKKKKMKEAPKIKSSISTSLVVLWVRICLLAGTTGSIHRPGRSPCCGATTEPELRACKRATEALALEPCPATQRSSPYFSAPTGSPRAQQWGPAKPKNK